MLSISCSDLTISVERRAPGRGAAESLGPGLIGSVVLHALVAFLVFFALPSLMQTPPESAQAVSIDLVSLGDMTRSPPGHQLARLPQEQAPESPRLHPVDPVPERQAPPPTPQALKAAESVLREAAELFAHAQQVLGQK